MKYYQYAAFLLAALVMRLAGCPTEPEAEKPSESFSNTDLVDTWSAAGKTFTIKSDGTFDALITIAAGSPALPVTGKLRHERGDDYRLQDMHSSEAGISGILTGFNDLPVRLTLVSDKQTFTFQALGESSEAALANTFFGGDYTRGGGKQGSFNTGLLGKWITGDEQKSIEIRDDTDFTADITYLGFKIPVTGKLEFVSGNTYTLKGLATTNASFAALVQSFKGVLATLALAEDNRSFVFSAAGTEPEATDANSFFGGTYNLVDEGGTGEGSSDINPDLIGAWSGGPGGGLVTVNSYTINADGTYTANVNTPLGVANVSGRFAHISGDQYRLKDLDADNALVASMMNGLNDAPVTLTVSEDKQSFTFVSQNTTIQTYYGGVYTRIGE